MSNQSSKVSVSARPAAVKNLFSLRARIGVLLLGLLLSSLALITPASAATITVGNAGDPATGDAAKCNAASTCTLRDAIAKATAVTGTAASDTIVFSLPANSTITLSGSELVVDRNLTIDGSAVTGLAVSGNNASRVFRIDGGYDEKANEFIVITVTLKRLVIEHGMVTGNGHIALGGGGIWSRGTLTLDGSTIVNNAADVGGGIANASGNLTLTGSAVLNNVARAPFSDGGGIENNGTLELNGSTVSGNTAAYGGGIYNVPGSTLTLTSSTVSGNAASGSGGGINNHGTLTLSGSVVSDNIAASGVGGGIANDYSGSSILAIPNSTVTNSTITGNVASNGKGGGIANFYTSILTLTNSMIANNTAGHGGGGAYNDGILTLTGSTVTNNAAEFGGGIFNDYQSPLTLTNSTVTDNTANNGRGGGIYNQGPLTLTHGTLAGNTAAGDIYNRNDSSVTASAMNTIVQSCAVEGNSTKALSDSNGNLDGGSGCGFTDAGSKSNATLDLGTLADNGGPTLTMMPGANSDAIGFGLPSACSSAPVNSRDQRGYVRPAIGCASGAVDPNGSANDSIFFDGFGFGGH